MLVRFIRLQDDEATKGRVAMPRDSYTEGYLKGYEEGLNEAWNDVVKLTARGLTSREIAIRARAVIGTMYQKTEDRRLELTNKQAPQAPSAPVREVAAPQPLFTPAEGGCYIVREPRPDRSLKIFSAITSQPLKGLCISRTGPNTMKNCVRSSSVAFLWLTKADESKCHENCIQPDLSRVQTAIKDFMDANRSGIILLDGINYLIIQNDFGRVLRFVQSLRDEVVARKYSLVIPVDPQQMDPREYKQLEAEMQVI